MSPDPESVTERVLSGRSRNLQLMAAEGLLPLSTEALIPLQVRLARSEDIEIASKARESLRALDPRIAAPVLAHETSDEVLELFATTSEHPLVLETIVRQQNVPMPVLLGLARRVSPDLQEILILRQDAILEEPGLLDALEQNPTLSPSVKRRIGEYREHLLPRQRPVRSAPDLQPEPGDAEEEHARQEEVDAAIHLALMEPEAGEIDEQTGLSEGQIRTLPIPVRLQLSRGASKTLRDILIRDSNPLVAVSVLRNNSYSDGEIERVAHLRTVVEEVLDAIGQRRQWMRKYRIAQALVKNPRTPIPLAVRMVPRMGVRDLKLLRRDRNVSEAVRKTANRLFMHKMK